LLEMGSLLPAMRMLNLDMGGLGEKGGED
jgi:hypothetical protein